MGSESEQARSLKARQGAGLSRPPRNSGVGVPGGRGLLWYGSARIQQATVLPAPVLEKAEPGMRCDSEELAMCLRVSSDPVRTSNRNASADESIRQGDSSWGYVSLGDETSDISRLRLDTSPDSCWCPSRSQRPARMRFNLLRRG